jgi:group I intron endonuclease
MKSNIELPKGAGIYKITCDVNGKIYIGKSITIQNRIKSYKYFRKNKPRGRFVNAINKYGYDMFTVEILEVVDNFNVDTDNDKLLLLESEYIKRFNSTDPIIGYNMCAYSTDFSGRKHTKESRENMSRGKLGTTHSEETKIKMSKSKIGIKVSDETRKNMSMAQRRKNQTEETKLRRINCRLGKTHSEGSLEKMRKAKLGKKLSEETIQKMLATRARNKIAKLDKSS